VPYEYPEGDAELNVMEVHGIAVLRWHPEDAEDDVLGAMHQQEAAHADDVEDALAIPGTLRLSQALSHLHANASEGVIFCESIEQCHHSFDPKPSFLR
jgi:hypothetical protein